MTNTTTCYLNGEYLPLNEAHISPLDRGFLFGDGGYEVVPVYSRKLFRVDDVPAVRISASEPIGFQMDGDYLGLREHVDFRSVADTLDVIAPGAPAQP